MDDLIKIYSNQMYI